jgi:hypothetical protein
MEKHKAVVMGEVHLKRYRYDKRNFYFHHREIYAYGELKEKKVIWSGELDNPPIEEGEKLYIAESNVTVVIESKEKSTEGGYVYWTDFVSLIEDEETMTSLEKAKEDKKKYEEYLENQEDKSVKAAPSGKKWWQFWK